MATPVFLPGEFPWTEEPGGLQSMGSFRVRHNWATKRTPNPLCPLVQSFIWTSASHSGSQRGCIIGISNLSCSEVWLLIPIQQACSPCSLPHLSKCQFHSSIGPEQKLLSPHPSLPISNPSAKPLVPPSKTTDPDSTHFLLPPHLILIQAPPRPPPG